MVDDSAVVRTTLTTILSGAGMRVAVAGDAIVAMKMVLKSRPDAIVLDIEMPRMDGLTFLRWLRAESNPVPCLICSSHVGGGTAAAMYALECGAVGIVAKPPTNLEGFLKELADELVDTVRGATGARVVRLRPPPERGRKPVDKNSRLPHRGSGTSVIAIGASAGGPEALHTLLESLPPGAPGIVVVQHMPEGFTAAFARSLNDACSIEVKEAAPFDRVTVGRALIAPGNSHLSIRRSGDAYLVDVTTGPRVNRHRPSVDVLFQSVAQAAGSNAVGVILTGMGEDGARGLLEMRRAGARTVAQDEATSAIFGMPSAAISLGAASEVLPLQRIAETILS